MTVKCSPLSPHGLHDRVFAVASKSALGEATRLDKIRKVQVMHAALHIPCGK